MVDDHCHGERNRITADAVSETKQGWFDARFLAPDKASDESREGVYF